MESIALYTALFALLVATGGVLLGYKAYLDAQVAHVEPPGLAILRESVTAHQRMIDDLMEAPETHFEPFVELLTEFAARMDRYEQDLEEGLDIARRREARVRQAVHRALKRYEEDGEIDPGLAALVEEVQPGDGRSEPEEGVRDVHEDLEWDQPSSIPGVSLGQLRQARMR